MNISQIVRRRLHNLRLSRPAPASPQEVVGSLLAMQSQDHGPAKWSVVQRSPGLTQMDLDRAFETGDILRTHVLRPTWHYVTPADIRSLLAVTGPRVQAHSESRYNQLGLDVSTRRKSDAAIAKALEKAGRLTRKELGRVLERKGFDISDQRLPWLLSHSELEGTICSGGMEGKQHTYALLDERAGPAKRIDVEKETVEFVRRYFESHGPASVDDLRWWSSLRVSEIKVALQALGSDLASEVVEGITYWYAPSDLPRARPSPTFDLLQAYDEYIVGYRETRVRADVAGRPRAVWERSLPTGVVLLDGYLVGHWKRTLRKEVVAVEVYLHHALDTKQERALARAASDFGRFLGSEAELSTRLL